jgi:Cu+-exporting ATPase|tara:strand:+ start:34940 stop:35314 length:375 start_codon:yes stop_codon:yes gene_type:complete
MSLKNILISMFLLTALASCKNEGKAEIKTINIHSETSRQALDPNATYSKAEFSIKGMTCEMGCARTIEKKLAKMNGMKSATVDFKNESAIIEYDTAKITTSSIKEAVSSVSAIYSVEAMQTIRE